MVDDGEDPVASLLHVSVGADAAEKWGQTEPRPCLATSLAVKSIRQIRYIVMGECLG